jgi:AraC family ethanolamine operon transcriptional activator
MQQLFHLVKQRSPLLYRSDFRWLIIEDLLPLLIDTIPRMKSSAKKNLLPKKKIKPALKAREYILNNLQQPLTLKKLYQAIDSSRRNLYYSFEATFGMTPMHYVKAMRLQGLHRELKAAEPEKTLVMNIASRWGFWSAGHLARDYKKMFGELPSETLSKNWQLSQSR